MENQSIRRVVQYRGRVQGVGFRMTTVSLANGLGVHGTVRNEHDGSVTLDVEGQSKEVNRLLDRIQREMSDNIVEALVDERPVKGHRGGLSISYA